MVYANIENSPYMMKVDSKGNFEWHTWDYTLKYPLYLPLRGLSEFDGTFYFVTENQTGSGKPITLMKLESNSETPVIAAQLGNENEITRVYASQKFNNKILILSSTPVLHKATIMCINLDGSIVWEKIIDYTVRIQENYPAVDRRYHFFGEIDANTFFCNTYKGDDIITMKINANGDIIDEVSFDHPITAIQFFENDYAFSFPIWDIYGIQTNNSVAQTENGVSNRDNSFMQKFSLNNKQYAMFSANARDNMIMLKVFDAKTNNTIYKKYYGHTYFYNAGGLLPTKDGGLLLYGNAYVLGRLGRILLVKISKDELVTSIGDK